MKTKYTTLFLSFMLFFVATSISFSQNTIYSNDFELNNGGWTDGGGDCEFRSNDSNSPQGNASWRIKDDRGNNSAFWQDFDFSAYDEITITFSFKSIGFDDDDDRFKVEFDDIKIIDKRYSENGWNSNNTYYTESVTINKYDYDFINGTEIKIDGGWLAAKTRKGEITNDE